MTPKTYRTPDLYMAAYIRTVGSQQGVEMLDPERVGGRFFFLFRGEEGAIEAVKRGWFGGTGVVPAEAYAHAIKSLKSMIHSGGTGPRT